MQKFFSDLWNYTVTPDFDPGSSLDSRVHGNDGEAPITVRLEDSMLGTAKRTLFLADAIIAENRATSGVMSG